MRGKKAKAIRRLVYQAIPKKSRREIKIRYVQDPDSGVIYATDYRRTYKDAKRFLRKMRGKKR